MKKYLLGLFAVILAVGLSSFTAPKQEQNTTLQWFKFVGTDNTSASDYYLSEEPPCDDPSGIICGVYGTEDQTQLTHPDFVMTHNFTRKQ
jgi:hypothetical protein